MQDLERENQQLRQRIAEQDAKILHLTKLAEGLQRQIHKTLLELAEAQAKIAELQKAKKKEKDPSSSTASAEEASASEEDAPGLSAAERARLLREERLRRRAERKGRTPKGTPRRQELPAHLERRVESVPLGECPDCHQQNWSVFPEAETSEKLDYQPAKLVVRRTERQKGRCRGCQKIFTAPLPATVVPRGQVTEGLLAHLVYSKCALHLPLARIAEDFQQQGVEMASSTLSDFMGHVADLLEPIYDTLVHRLLSKDLIQLDGTGLDVLKPGEEGKYRGQVAVYCCDDEDQITVYQFTEDKKGEHFEDFLRLKSKGRPPPYRGYIVADAGTNLDRLYHYEGVEECGCWEHAREKFVEARVSSPKEAEEGLAWINTLFEIEHQSKDAEESAPARLARRLREVPELQKGFERWRGEMKGRFAPEEELNKAIRYVERHGAALWRFLKDGRIPLTNNLSERELGVVGRGRKNWLFAGSDIGGRRLAVLLSVVRTNQRLGNEVWEYLTWVLPQLTDQPMNRQPGQLAKLTPWAYKEARKAMRAAS